LHDLPTLGGAYDRSAESVKYYLKEYPSIRYVIDLHRDAILNETGELLRAVWGENEEKIAQVMAVVGTDANGTDFPHWENNLAFALQLRAVLNADGKGICRPIFLRNASFHQELAPCSILLEIGTSGNSVDEAKRAAELVGDALAILIYE
jgi:stage II sporulation protein P